MRFPSVAGLFYPDTKREIEELFEVFKNNAKEAGVEGKLKGLIVPHAGYVFSGVVAYSAYSLLKKKKDEVKRIFLLGPSHYYLFRGLVDSGEEVWLTPIAPFFVKNRNNEFVAVNSGIHQPEHCLEVQLPFLQHIGIDGRERDIYLWLFSEEMPENIARYLEGELKEGDLIIISSDLSHYLPYPQAVQRDKESIRRIETLATEKEIDACGRIGIKALMHLAKRFGWKAKLLDYRNSGDTYGDKSRVVGYASIAFFK